MNRVEIAQETLKIQQQGRYTHNGREISIAEMQTYAEQNSFLVTPEEAIELRRETPPDLGKRAVVSVVNRSAVGTILDCGNGTAVLNFASAKNPGGGFLKGAMAQEEALAASSGLYHTLLRHPAYYEKNRRYRSMCYTDHAIYSPNVPFFRDENFALIDTPVTASVLTLPAVNMAQVQLRGEDEYFAKETMKNRMQLALALFARQTERRLILGAYGCGVFRNDPVDVAGWWQTLLEDEGYIRAFDEILFAVLDRSKRQENIRIFAKTFG